MKYDFSNYVHATALSSFGEGPLHEYENAVLRFTYSLSFSGYYLVRLHATGEIVFKSTAGGKEPDGHFERIAAKYFQNDDDLKKIGTAVVLKEIPAEFFYEITPESRAALTEEKVSIAPGDLEQVLGDLKNIEDRLGPDQIPAKVLQIDGDSYQVELAGMGRGYSLAGSGAFDAPFMDLLRLLKTIRGLVSRNERLVFGANSPIAKMDAELLRSFLESEMDSLSAFVFAFVPTANVRAVLDRFAGPRAERIRKIAAGIDPTDEIHSERFRQIENILWKKSQADVRSSFRS